MLWADSHRIRADLEAPEHEFVRREKTTDRAQAALADLWRRAHRKFDKLKESLQAEGQTEPGVITREGILINGNTRLVALRELGRDWIRVAVLDSDAHPPELADLELRLQVRETGHDTYRLSNEFLFIQELFQGGRTAEEIAKALNWSPSRAVIGRQKVELYLRLLELVRNLQRRDQDLPITFFDEGSSTGKLQQLKELDLAYSDLISAGDIASANSRLDTWLLVARSGFASVHQIRAVTRRDDFLTAYLLPRLGEQPVFGE
jgi:ParB-like chromosome segregation protein Spo0J